MCVCVCVRTDGMPTGMPEIGIPTSTAGAGCWLDLSQPGGTWMKRGATREHNFFLWADEAPLYSSCQEQDETGAMNIKNMLN